jgi:hypothetical protein
VREGKIIWGGGGVLLEGLWYISCIFNYYIACFFLLTLFPPYFWPTYVYNLPDFILTEAVTGGVIAHMLNEALLFLVTLSFSSLLST